MVKKIILVIATTIVVMAGDFTLDKRKSEVFYEAQKEQFFRTYTILGVNKGLSGSLQKTSDGYRGSLNVNSFSFITDSERRDSNVKEHLNSEKYKLITYSYELHGTQSSGVMIINGVSKKITFPVIINENQKQILVEGNITIKYSDFNIETPSNLILSAHDDLLIGAKLYFSK